MRKLILQMQMSLDGYAAGPDGELEWIFEDIDAEYEEWGSEQLWNTGLHVMGRATYRDMAAHWPTSTEPYAPPMNAIPKAVFSRTLKTAGWGESRIVSGDLAPEIARLKQEPGKPMRAYGGVSFARALIGTGLIDEYHLIVHSIALGRGLAPFGGLAAPLRLRLAETKIFQTGIVAQVLHPA
jgi:dihydrofolate reductase